MAYWFPPLGTKLEFNDYCAIDVHNPISNLLRGIVVIYRIGNSGANGLIGYVVERRTKGFAILSIPIGNSSTYLGCHHDCL